MVASLVVTLGLFAFVAWHAVAGAGPAGQPRASVTAVDGSVYEVTLRNPTDAGLASATVVADCGDPPRQVVFRNVPPGTRRTATVSCPPGTGPPGVDVVQWVRA